MKARKPVSVLLALLLALAIVPMTAGAAGEPFCTVGSASYDDLAAAAAEASSSGQPILITKDFDYAGQLELDGITVAVELQNFTLNITQASGTGAAGAGLYVRNGGALAVNGPGTLNFAGTSAGIYVGSAAAGDYGTVSITGAATVNATGSHGVVSNNSQNEVQVTGALGGSAAGDFCVYCLDGKVEVFGSITPPDNGPPVRNGVYADNDAEVHVYGHIVSSVVGVHCPAAAAARVWVLGRFISGDGGFSIKIGNEYPEGVMALSAYPGYEERYRIQKYSGANAVGKDPEFPLGYVFESRVWIKIPVTITPEPITGVTSPKTGAFTSVTRTGAINNGTNYTAEFRGWTPNPDKFNAGTVYTATIQLTANPGYDFNGLTTDAQIEGFTVNGIKPKFVNLDEMTERLTFSVTFPITRGVFGTNPRYTGGWAYLLFFLCFGWIWMWF